mmetsp:Transcript_10241/g.28091  ORF Transcript_10241/g.28091 Transcript_10241/m.28091 type:complete len:285 (-) Transcript_10241:14-868(-)
MSLRSCQIQWCASVIVRDGDVSLENLNEIPHDIQLSPTTQDVQCCVASCIDRVDVNFLPCGQRLSEIPVPSQARHVDHGSPINVSSIGLHIWAIDQVLCHFLLPCCTCEMHWRLLQVISDVDIGIRCFNKESDGIGVSVATHDMDWRVALHVFGVHICTQLSNQDTHCLQSPVNACKVEWRLLLAVLDVDIPCSRVQYQQVRNRISVSTWAVTIQVQGRVTLRILGIPIGAHFSNQTRDCTVSAIHACNVKWRLLQVVSNVDIGIPCSRQESDGPEVSAGRHIV